MLFITTNDRSTRFWSKLGEGFFRASVYSNITSFFHFVNKRASYSFGIISLAHAAVNVTDFSIGSINCYPNNADRGRSIIRVTYIVQAYI